MSRRWVQLVVRYGAPSILSMWVFTLYTMADGFFVGRYVGTVGLAAVSMSMPLINAMFAVGVMIGMGGSTLAGICYGAGRNDSGDVIYSRSILMSLASGALFGAVLFAGGGSIARLLGADQALSPLVAEYLTTLAPFSLFFMTGYGLEAFTKIDGAPSWPVVCVTVGGLANVFLDYVTVALWGWGLYGAALATGVSQLVSFLLILGRLSFFARRVNLRPVRLKLRPCFEVLRSGFPEFLNELSIGLTALLFNFILMRRIGSEGVAVFGVVYYVSSLVSMTFVGLGQGVAPLLSLSLGKNDRQALRNLFSVACCGAALGALAFGLFTQLNASAIVGLFITDGSTGMASWALRLYGTAFFISGGNSLIGTYFTAIHRPKLASAVTLLRGFGFVSLALCSLPLVMGAVGIWLAVPLSEAATLVVSLLLYRFFGQPDSAQEELQPVLSDLSVQRG